MGCAEKGFFVEEQIVFPPEERLAKKAVAIAECCQEIPCNPCVDACPVGAIQIPENINNTPVVDFEKCTGCALCLGVCPGLSLFLVDGSNDYGVVTIPYELFPPEEGETVDLLDRSGDVVGEGEVKKVRLMKKHDKTLLVSLKMEKDLMAVVRGFGRKK